MVTHEIRAQDDEYGFYTIQLTSNLDEYLNIHNDENETTLYECTCGEEFNSREASIEHLKTIHTDNTGEQATIV